MSQLMNMKSENVITAGKNWIFSVHCATTGTASGAAVKAAVITRKNTIDAVMRVILSSRFIQRCASE
jgi:hypothetical protein